jgi:hypothetical protein
MTLVDGIKDTLFNVDIYCKYIFTKGKNVGKRCTVRPINNDYCKEHKKYKQVKEKQKDNNESKEDRAKKEKLKYYSFLAKRLYDKVNIINNTNYEKPCLEFTGSKSYNNGIINVNGVYKPAQYVSYALSKNIFIEDIPLKNEKGEFLHIYKGYHCCNNLCIEPSHLNLLTKNEYNSLFEIEKSKTNKEVYYKNFKLKERVYKNTTSVKNENYETPCVLNKIKQIYVYDKMEFTYRISFAIYNNIYVENIPKTNEKGEILELCHGHDCPKECIEPTHLSLKTKYQNNYEDKIRDSTINRGENHYNNKISEELATQIKHSKGDGTIEERSIKFSVSSYIINCIDNNNAWAHIPNKDGIIVESSRREKSREIRKKSNETEFTEEDFNNALEVLNKRSVESDNIEPTVKSKCLLFIGCLGQDGYGKITFKNIDYRTHILAWEAKNKEKTNMLVRHICNIRNCCNPDHLIIGTRRENSLDFLSYSKQVKLKEAEVKEIKKLFINSNLSNKEISKIYKVSDNTISRIRNGHTWSHIK